MVDSHYYDGSGAGPSQAHPAFPQIQSLNQAGNPQTVKPPLPNDAQAVYELIASQSSLATIQRTLVPTLNDLCDGPLSQFAFQSPKAADPRLALEGISLSGVTDDHLRAQSIGFVFVLLARMTRSGKNFSETLDLAFRLCAVADPAQLALAPSRVTEFAWAIFRLTKGEESARWAVDALHSLLLRTTQDACFNPVHAVFLEACLVARDIPRAFQTLDVIYVHVRKGGVSYLDVLTFHHHAGTVAAAAGDYEKATDFFVFAAAMPTQAASAIQLACAKRATLCELLRSGKQVQYPKDTSRGVLNIVEKEKDTYIKLAKAFQGHDWKAVSEAVKQGEPQFKEDCNRGLVDRLLASITKRRILRLRKDYSRVTLEELCSMVSAPQEEVKVTIEHLVSTNEIRATIDGTPEIVTFIEDDDYASPENMIKLRKAQERAEWFLRDLTEANRTMGLNTSWLKKQVKSIEAKEKTNRPAEFKGGFDDITGGMGLAMPGGSGVRGVGSNLADIGF